MRKIHPLRSLIGLALLLGGAIGCHQEPVIPVSGIPVTCQIYSIANVNEGVHDTTSYHYNSFGSIDERSFRQSINGQLTNSSRQKFVYSADHFLTTLTEQNLSYSSGNSQPQTNKLYTYLYQNGQVQQVEIVDSRSGQPLGFKLYTYENEKLKTYVETNAQKIVIRSYLFDGSGKLTQLTEPGSTLIVTNGKVTKRTLQDGTVIGYQFDNQGQLLSEITTTLTGQTERSYTYDNRPYWNKTQLLMRGIPVPDLGGHTFLHNISTSRLKQTQGGRTIQDQEVTYQYNYNKANYSLGYSRSDGVRQRISYTNCL